jgi:hypothetical protein
MHVAAPLLQVAVSAYGVDLVWDEDYTLVISDAVVCREGGMTLRRAWTSGSSVGWAILGRRIIV